MAAKGAIENLAPPVSSVKVAEAVAVPQGGGPVIGVIGGEEKLGKLVGGGVKTLTIEQGSSIEGSLIKNGVDPGDAHRAYLSFLDKLKGAGKHSIEQAKKVFEHRMMEGDGVAVRFGSDGTPEILQITRNSGGAALNTYTAPGAGDILKGMVDAPSPSFISHMEGSMPKGVAGQSGLTGMTPPSEVHPPVPASPPPMGHVSLPTSSPSTPSPSPSFPPDIFERAPSHGVSAANAGIASHPPINPRLAEAFNDVARAPEVSGQLRIRPEVMHLFGNYTIPPKDLALLQEIWTSGDTLPSGSRLTNDPIEHMRQRIERLVFLPGRQNFEGIMETSASRLPDMLSPEEGNRYKISAVALGKMFGGVVRFQPGESFLLWSRRLAEYAVTHPLNGSK